MKQRLQNPEIRISKAAFLNSGHCELRHGVESLAEHKPDMDMTSIF